MSTQLLLTFKPQLATMSPADVGSVLMAVQALYHNALREHAGTRRPFGPPRGLEPRYEPRSAAILGEIEYLNRAAEAMSQREEPGYLVQALQERASYLAQRLALGEVEQERLRPEWQLEIRSLSMASPLEFIGSIPDLYVGLGGGAAIGAFLGTLEAKFNMVGRIKLERTRVQIEQVRADIELDELRARRDRTALDEGTTEPMRLIRGELVDDDKQR